MSFWALFIQYAFILTYIVVGFIVALEAILCMSGSHYAIKWVRRLYNLKSFMISVYIFYPMLWIVYFLLEVIPYYLGSSKELTKFDIPMMLYRIFPEECDRCESDE